MAGAGHEPVPPGEAGQDEPRGGHALRVLDLRPLDAHRQAPARNVEPGEAPGGHPEEAGVVLGGARAPLAGPGRGGALPLRQEPDRTRAAGHQEDIGEGEEADGGRDAPGGAEAQGVRGAHDPPPR
jgi:hypothetical protein